MQASSTPVITEQIFKVSKEELWQAITNPREMRKWFFEDMPNYKPEPGFETRFNVDAGERQFMHLWKITEVIPYKKLVCNWRYEGYNGNADVTYEIFEEADRCKLRVTASGIETFPDTVPEFKRESCEGGWNYFIKQRLVDYFKQ